ncbi:hypothetical protein QVD17_41679 [Tagetes erecta]|uniref:Uncharacterized protein n=1 Tax=Tagetes erecta TaxID=13708 RepID=A0AAD8NDW0_TARER|nr:hypothetical protein QVD17_41679 [Tagetes erecta]
MEMTTLSFNNGNGYDVDGDDCGSTVMIEDDYTFHSLEWSISFSVNVVYKYLHCSILASKNRNKFSKLYSFMVKIGSCMHIKRIDIKMEIV